ISDTFGRPWREGLANVALGVSGMASLIDYRGQMDSHGNPLRVTVIAVADELASAAELVMKKSAEVPVVIIRGYEYQSREGSGRELIRLPELDLFRCARSPVILWVLPRSNEFIRFDLFHVVTNLFVLIKVR